MSARVVIYSDDSDVRAAIKAALGSKLASDLPIETTEFATADAMRQYIDQTDAKGQVRADLFILDGESTPEGGMGISRELKDEVFNCPPVLLIAGRVQDAWLATWSRADDVLLHPIDPFTLADKAANLLRSRSVALN